MMDHILDHYGIYWIRIFGVKKKHKDTQVHKKNGKIVM